MIFRLSNTIMPYAWGSHHAIAKLQGREDAVGPEAELWLGAHAQAPSRVHPAETAQASDAAPTTRLLSEVIAESPREMLGAQTIAQFGAKLPFLTKVLAAVAPLSLQAHPSKAQAEAGFLRENAEGIALTDPARSYRDDNHKPELLCALEPIRALCGFRDVNATLALIDDLGCAELAPFRTLLSADPTASGLRAVFTEMRFGAGSAACARAVVQACTKQDGPFATERRTLAELGHFYPGDPGILVAMLLNVVEIVAGEAIYLPAGNMHAYLHGVGVEIMASSDNVLRGGLTPKHVDVAELMHVLNFAPSPPHVIAPEVDANGEAHYVTPAHEFELSRIDLKQKFEAAVQGPEILLVTEGRCELTSAGVSTSLRHGESAFISANSARFILEGHARVFRSRVPYAASVQRTR